MSSGGRQEIDPLAAGTSRPVALDPARRSSGRHAGPARVGRQAGGGTLFTEHVLVVNQKAKLFGSTLGYAVYNQNGQQLGTVQELRRDLGTKLSDNLRGRTDRTAPTGSRSST